MTQGLLIGNGIFVVTHSVVCSGDDEKMLRPTAGFVVFIGHSHRHESVVRAVDQKHRKAALK